MLLRFVPTPPAVPHGARAAVWLPLSRGAPRPHCAGAARRAGAAAGSAGAARRMNAADADAQLIERVKRGDLRAFEMLVVKYQRRIERLIGRMVRDVDLVQDIAQETFIRAYRALPQFRGESAFYTWLYRIAVNTAKKALSRPEARPGRDRVGARARVTTTTKLPASRPN